jgi:hypothetical protein
MVQTTYGWGVTLNEMIDFGEIVDIPTPGFDVNRVDTANAEVAYGGHLLTSDQCTLEWAEDGSRVIVTNDSDHTWEVNQGVYVSCPRLAPDIESLEGIAAELADHEARLSVVETTASAHTSEITDLQARVAALEAAVPPATQQASKT